MRYSTTLSRPDGKTITLAANEWLDIDIMDGNKRIAQLTVRDGHVYDHNDSDIETATGHNDPRRGY